MNIYEDNDPDEVELLSVVAKQPDRKPRASSTKLSAAGTQGMVDDDDVPLLRIDESLGRGMLRDRLPNNLVVGRGPFWTGRVWSRSRQAWWASLDVGRELTLRLLVLGTATCVAFVFIVVWVVVSLVDAREDGEWSFGFRCNDYNYTPAHNTTGHNYSSSSGHRDTAFAEAEAASFGPHSDAGWVGVEIEMDDDDGSVLALQTDCLRQFRYFLVCVSSLALVVGVAAAATVHGWCKSGPKQGGTVLDLPPPSPTGGQAKSRHEFLECLSFWCCEKFPGLFCDWVCSAGCGFGGFFQMFAAICFPGPAQCVDSGGACTNVCAQWGNNTSRRPRHFSCHDTPFACGSGHCYLPTGFCPCLNTRRMLWWAASEYSDEEAAKVATNVLARSRRAEVLEYAPTNSGPSLCSLWLFPAGANVKDNMFHGYRCPLSLACELNKPGLAAILLENGATVWNRKGDALPNQAQYSSSSNSPAHVVAATGNLDIFALLHTHARENKDVYAYVCVASPTATEGGRGTSLAATGWDRGGTDRGGGVNGHGVPCHKQPSWGVQYEIPKTSICVAAQGTTFSKHAAALPIIDQTIGSDGTTWVMFKHSPGPGWYPLAAKGGGKPYFDQVHWLDLQNSEGHTPVDVARNNGHYKLVLQMERVRSNFAASVFIRDVTSLLAFSRNAVRVPLPLDFLDSVAKSKKNALAAFRRAWPGDQLLRLEADNALASLMSLSREDVDRCAAAVPRHLESEVEMEAALLQESQSVSLPLTSLSKQLRPVKEFLEDYVQSLLQFGTAQFDALPQSFFRVLMAPAEHLIRKRAFEMAEQVRRSPDRTLARIAELAAPDSRIYTAQLKKALREGGQLQFDNMVQRVSGLLRVVNDSEPPTQPCCNPLELTVYARAAIPIFTKLVDVMVSNLHRDGYRGIAVSHRPVSKGTYRIIEKCLLKVPGEDILTKLIDASKVLDVAGCLIACSNFEEIQAVVDLVCNAGGSGEHLVHEIQVQRQKPPGIEKKEWRGITIVSEVSSNADETVAGGRTHVPLMMRLTAMKQSFNSLWPGMFILPEIVRVDVDHHSEELGSVNVGDVVEVHEQLQTRQRHWYGVYGQYYDCMYTKVRITCHRTSITGWMTQRINIQDGNGWVDFMEPVLPTTPLGSNASYTHTVTSLGPGNTAMELVVGDQITSIDGNDVSTMHPYKVTMLLNNHHIDRSVCVVLERWHVCRIKDTWTGRSKAGWRDYKVNIKVAGVIFEIQIVLAGMMTARSRLNGHVAYNDFRFLYECILYLGDADLQRRLEVASESKLHESYTVGRSVSAAEQAAEGLEEALFEIEVLQEDLKMKDAEMKSLKAGNSHLKAKIALLKAEQQ